MNKKRRIQALAIGAAAVFGLTSVAGFNGTDSFRVRADEQAKKMVEKVVFAQGQGQESEFSEDAWNFYACAKDGTVKSEYFPAVVNDGKEGQYLGTGDNQVIRLIRGVKESSTSGIEAADSYDAYRTGSAFLKQGIALNDDAEFSVVFTFSMPEAVVNQTQTGGAEYSREVGGDGIALVMTTDADHEVQAGSGIGYQGMDNSQLYFHKGSKPDGTNDYINPEDPYESTNVGDDDYENYENYENNERFDHIGVTLNGNVKKHEAVYYINQLDPTKLVDGQYVNLRNRYYHTAADTTSANASTSSTCATRFADKGVDNRLFTCWVRKDCLYGLYFCSWFFQGKSHHSFPEGKCAGGSQGKCKLCTSLLVER